MTARDWFKRAEAENFAIGAFNVDNLEILKAVCLAGKNKNSPVMLEFSPGEIGYFGLRNIVDLVVNAREEYQIPVLLNLDHAKHIDDCLAAIKISRTAPATPELAQSSDGGRGFDNVHYDGSGLSFEENVANTKKIVDTAHAKGLLVEGEIDRIFGSSEVHATEVDLETLKESYTHPQKAAQFVVATGVDIFAAVFGNVHGTFPNQPGLDLKLLAEIRTSLPNTFLSMHGGSGIPAEEVREAIKVGKIVKVNVNTELRQAFRDALIEKLGENPAEYTFYKITPDIILTVAAVIESKIEVLGSANRL